MVSYYFSCFDSEEKVLNVRKMDENTRSLAKNCIITGVQCAW